MPTWLKPSYIAIAILVILLGVQTVRLSNSQSETAQAVLKEKTLVADIATQRAAGIEEGVRRQREAQAKLDAEHEAIVAGLEADKAQLQKHYDNTYNMLREFAGQEKWGCLAQPLPEEVLNEFRR